MCVCEELRNTVALLKAGSALRQRVFPYEMYVCPGVTSSAALLLRTLVLESGAARGEHS